MSLERVVRVGDGGGGADESWVTVASVWASIRALSGDEEFTEHRVSGRVTHEVTLRYRSDVEPEMRMSRGTRIFEIRGIVDPDDRRRRLICFCEEREL